MATWQITGPDGKTYRVEGETPEGAARAVAAMVGGSASAQPVKDDRQAMRDRIAAAKAGTLEVSPESRKRAAEADQIAQDQMTLAAAGPGAGVVAKASQGLPFVGEWVDEAFDYLDPGRGQRVRDLQGAMDRQSPKAALAAEIGGGIVGSIPLAIGAVGAAGRASTNLGKVTRGAAIAGAGGATEGAIAGAGRANDGDRARGARQGALIGGGLGVALGAVAPLAADGLKALAQRVKRLDVRTISEEFGLSSPAARVVKSALMNDDLDAAAQQLSRIGDDAMLADAGPATANLLDSAAQSGGEALRVTRDAVETRAQQSGARLAGALDRILGPAEGVKAAARDISQRTSRIRQEAYQRAYSSPIDYSGPGRRIESVLSRIPPRTLDAAISEANDAMRAEGLRNMQIMAQIADDGSVTFREMPNVQQLDFIKRALGDLSRTETDTFGRLTGAGIRAQKLAGELRDAIADAVPSYSRAVKLGGDKIAEDQALDLGRRLLSRSTTLEDAQSIMANASVEAKAAARRGLREQIENTLSNVRRTITDANTDAREAMALVKELSSRANEKKARLVLGDDASALFNELEKAEAALALRAAVSRNSATAQRLAIQGEIKAQGQPSLLRRVLGKGGNPLEGAQELTETLAGIDPRSISETEKQLMAEIARSLVNLRGDDAQRALRAVRRAMAGQPIKDAEAALIGRVLSGSSSATGYQVGTQSQQQPQPR